MTLEKAQQDILKAQVQVSKARESFVKAIISETGANPRKVEKVEVNSFRTLLRAFRR